MFSDFQSALVAHLDGKKSDPVSAGRIAPLLVKPYGGELLAPKRLLPVTPIVFVEFDDAALEIASMGGGSVKGSIGPSLLCAARNAASAEAQHGDGMALLTWTFEAMLGATFVLGDYVLELSRLSVRRLQSTEVWLARLIPEFTIG